MWCILYRDLSQIFKIRKKILLSYFLSILFLVLFTNILGISYMNIFYGILGFKFYKNNPIFIISYILNKMFFIYVTFCLFTYDFKNAKGNLFMRFSPSNWMLLKINSNIIITVILRSIIYLIALLIIYLFSGNTIPIINLLQYFLIDISYLLFIQLSSLFLFFLFQCKLILGIFFTLVYCIFSSYYIIDLSFNFIWIYIIFNFIFIILHIYFFRNEYVTLFERSSDY